jgi:hypothetical protein
MVTIYSSGLLRYIHEIGGKVMVDDGSCVLERLWKVMIEGCSLVSH